MSLYFLFKNDIFKSMLYSNKENLEDRIVKSLVNSETTVEISPRGTQQRRSLVVAGDIQSSP